MREHSIDTSSRSLAPIELRGIRNALSGQSVVFAIAIAKPVASRVFMEITQSGDASERHAVVFVDKDKFVTAWRREPYDFNKAAAHGMLDDPKLTAKYKAVESDFARSHEQPLALAYVVCRIPEEKKMERASDATCGRQYVSPPTRSCYVDFNDGVTRTAWLIANGARAFPVRIDVSETIALHDEAGLPEMPPLTIEQLFDAARNVSFDSDRRDSKRG